jgi:hypothetical protein
MRHCAPHRRNHAPPPDASMRHSMRHPTQICVTRRIAQPVPPRLRLRAMLLIKMRRVGPPPGAIEASLVDTLNARRMVRDEACG